MRTLIRPEIINRELVAPTRKTGNVVNLRVFVKKSCMLIK